MTGLIRDQLGRLAETIADLRDRVRAAVAGELGRHVAAAVEQIVRAVAGGTAGPTLPDPPPAYRPPPARWDDPDDGDGWGRPAGRWDDPDENDGRGHRYGREPERPAVPPRPVPAAAEPPSRAAAATSVAAGVYAARWWLGRGGTLPAAAGLGLAVALLGAAGGPAARAAAAALAAAADLLAATDALGDGAARLERL